MNLASYTERLFDAWTAPVIGECETCSRCMHPDYDECFESLYDKELEFCSQECADEWDEENGWEYEQDYEEENDAA